jgi:preprotein translocase subunit YajC
LASAIDFAVVRPRCRWKEFLVPFVDVALLVLPVVLIAMLFRAQRKRQRVLAAQQASLAVGQQIVTTSGLYATLVGLDDNIAVLEISPGATVRWDRRAVMTAPTAPTDPTIPNDEVSD